MTRARRLLIPLTLLLAMPVLAQEESPSAERKEAAGREKYKLDDPTGSFARIRDNTRFAWKVEVRENNKDADLYSEEIAYETALIHAARFPHADLEANARRDVPFQSLIDNERGSYRRELVTFQGHLRLLRAVDVTAALKDKNVEAVYEAWIFPADEQTPLCVFFSQLPEGLAVPKDPKKETLNRPVAVTGYYFKLAQYEQLAPDPTRPGKNKIWAAPVLIGRSITLLPEDALDGGMAWRQVYVPILVAGFSIVALTLVILSWRYRRGDRAVMERVRDKRNQNPFENV